jgi:hypothetical protein
MLFLAFGIGESEINKLRFTFLNHIQGIGR